MSKEQESNIENQFLEVREGRIFEISSDTEIVKLSVWVSMGIGAALTWGEESNVERDIQVTEQIQAHSTLSSQMLHVLLGSTKCLPLYKLGAEKACKLFHMLRYSLCAAQISEIGSMWGTFNFEEWLDANIFNKEE